jgi:indolepyruvate ferredoxin oxidoreductase, beta subunit
MIPTQPITLLVCALGGEGGGVLTDWVVRAAHMANLPVQATSIPGVAQRTGATTYYVEVFARPLSAESPQPVLSLNPLPGRLDVLLSSELLETARQIANGMPSAQRTLILTSAARTYTTSERMALGDGRVDSAALVRLVREHSRTHHVLDMAALAQQSGTVVSAVLLGALAGSGALPISRAQFEAAIGTQGASAQASQRGFAAGFSAVAQQQQHAQFVQQLLQPPAPVAASAKPWHEQSHAAQALWQRAQSQFAAEVQDTLALAVPRLVEWQNAAYAHRYLDRLQAVAQAEQAADPSAQHRHGITRETARWLALWMAFDDVVRVADLKSRRSRVERVRAEVKAQPTDVLKLYDHFKPGVPELAGLLPQRLAQPLLRWDRNRASRGLAPWGLPLKVASHSTWGLLMLRGMASLKWLRPHGQRFAAEQALMDHWLAAVVQGTQRSWGLGHELALCGRLIKGYGSTNERGKDTLLHLIDHLALDRDRPAAQVTAAVQAARMAALKDEAGRALDAALVQHGAPPRPVLAQPIRLVRRAAGAPHGSTPQRQETQK